MLRCLHPKRRVSQRFGMAVPNGVSVRPLSCIAMFLSARMKILKLAQAIESGRGDLREHERVMNQRPFAARFLPAFFSSASFSTSPG